MESPVQRIVSPSLTSRLSPLCTFKGKEIEQHQVKPVVARDAKEVKRQLSLLFEPIEGEQVKEKLFNSSKAMLAICTAFVNEVSPLLTVVTPKPVEIVKRLSAKDKKAARAAYSLPTLAERNVAVKEINKMLSARPASPKEQRKQRISNA